MAALICKLDDPRGTIALGGGYGWIVLAGYRPSGVRLWPGWRIWLVRVAPRSG